MVTDQWVVWVSRGLQKMFLGVATLRVANTKQQRMLIQLSPKYFSHDTQGTYLNFAAQTGVIHERTQPEPCHARTQPCFRVVREVGCHVGVGDQIASNQVTT